jgi:hypothetical protein
MSEVVHFHCVFVIADRKFQLAVGPPSHPLRKGLQRTKQNRTWDFTPNEFKVVLDGAQQQLADTTATEFHLDFPVGGITLEGREAYTAIVTYLQKVYDGWLHNERIK